MDNKTEIKKSKYTESQKLSIKKYRDNNREKYNSINKVYSLNYYNKHKNEEQFKQKNKEKAKRYYEKKKEEKKLKNTIENFNLNSSKEI